jgi:hypothetical protein
MAAGPDTFHTDFVTEFEDLSIDADGRRTMTKDKTPSKLANWL